MKQKYLLLCSLAAAAVFTFPSAVLALEEAEVESAIAASSKNEVAGNIFIWFLCAVAFLKISQKIDSFLSGLGMNVGRTGGSMLGELIIAGRVLGAAARSTGGVMGNLFQRGQRTEVSQSESKPVAAEGAIHGFAGIAGSAEESAVTPTAAEKDHNSSHFSDRVTTKDNAMSGGTVSAAGTGKVTTTPAASTGSVTGEKVSQMRTGYPGYTPKTGSAAFLTKKNTTLPEDISPVKSAAFTGEVIDEKAASAFSDSGNEISLKTASVLEALNQLRSDSHTFAVSDRAYVAEADEDHASVLPRQEAVIAESQAALKAGSPVPYERPATGADSFSKHDSRVFQGGTSFHAEGTSITNRETVMPQDAVAAMYEQNLHPDASGALHPFFPDAPTVRDTVAPAAKERTGVPGRTDSVEKTESTGTTFTTKSVPAAPSGFPDIETGAGRRTGSETPLAEGREHPFIRHSAASYTPTVHSHEAVKTVERKQEYVGYTGSVVQKAPVQETAGDLRYQVKAAEPISQIPKEKEQT